MRRSSLLGLIAMLPAALNLSAPAAGTILLPICTGDGQVHLMPLPRNDGPGGGAQNGCCIKGCHSGSNRKKIVKEFEPAQ